MKIHPLYPEEVFKKKTEQKEELLTKAQGDALVTAMNGLLTLMDRADFKTGKKDSTGEYDLGEYEAATAIKQILMSLRTVGIVVTPPEEKPEPDVDDEMFSLYGAMNGEDDDEDGYFNPFYMD